MVRFLRAGAVLLAVPMLMMMTARPAAAQAVLVPAPSYCPPVVSYYSAPPAVSYYAPPAVSYYPAPAVSYYSAPAVMYSAPAVSYYAAPAVSYYAAPRVTTYYRYGPRRVRATSYYYYP